MKLGSDPANFWHPWIGHWFGLRPADMADIYLEQYVAMYHWARQQKGK